MAHKKKGRLDAHSAIPALELLPSPQSPGEIVTLLQFAAYKGLASNGMVSHLEQMAALFPNEMVGAFQALRARRACNN